MEGKPPLPPPIPVPLLLPCSARGAHHASASVCSAVSDAAPRIHLLPKIWAQQRPSAAPPQTPMSATSLGPRPPVHMHQRGFRAGARGLAPWSAPDDVRRVHDIGALGTCPSSSPATSTTGEPPPCLFWPLPLALSNSGVELPDGVRSERARGAARRRVLVQFEAPALMVPPLPGRVPKRSTPLAVSPSSPPASLQTAGRGDLAVSGLGTAPVLCPPFSPPPYAAIAARTWRCGVERLCAQFDGCSFDAQYLATSRRTSARAPLPSSLTWPSMNK